MGEKHQSGAFECTPGWVAQLVRALSRYTKVAGLIPGWDGYNECINKWNKKLLFLSLSLSQINNNFKKDFTYLFLDRGEGREKERDRNINVWLPLACPLLGAWPTTQACALIGNQTSDPLVHRLALHPLSHTSQDSNQ